MNEKIEFATTYLKSLLGQNVKNIQQGHGSFLTMEFTKPKWYLWVYMCSWEIKIKNEVLAHSEDERDTIEKALQQIEGKTLIRAEILSSAYDMQLEFENEIILSLISNNNEGGNEQWMLFTPDNYVLTAGPNEKISYEPAS